ncbi:MAG: translocation/assembly module TamB domain-containing protein [Flavisolibacter sp.]
MERGLLFVTLLLPFPDNMDTEKKRISLPRKITRIVLKTILFIFLFVVFVFLLVLTPPVQRFLTSKVETYLQTKLKTKVQIGSISFGLSGRINLANVYIEDQKKDTLVSGGNIKAHLNYLRLFSNEVEVKDLEFQDITAKIKRVLPDTTFNFQFIVNAFVSEKSKAPDTAKTPPMKLNISDIALDNINLTFTDAITGNDMFAHIGTLSATIDTLDPYTQHFDIPTIIARNVVARVKQTKPLVTPQPLAKDLAEAQTPPTMKLNLGTIDLNKIAVTYDNDVSALYSDINIGQLKTNGKQIDLQNNRVYLDQLALNNSKFAVRLGKTQGAKLVAKETKQKVTAQKEAGWDFRIDHIRLDNNALQFDNDNSPRLARGLDYAHINSDSLSLYVDNFVMKPDSVGGSITKGTMRDRSGLQIDTLQTDFLYAFNQTYFKNLLIKTPGSEIRRSASLQYASFDALSKDFARTVFDIQLVNTRLQVKDILLFAPQLRSNPAMSNPNAVWYVNIVGNGTMNRINFESLRFDGLRNTHLNAKGTLAGLMNPKQAGGNFTIYRFHTTQSDLALFTGQRLSTPQINVPEEFDINGTVIGNAGHLNTNLNVNTSAGFMALRGSFSNLLDPNLTTYNATLVTRGLRVGSIMRQPDQFGSLSANITMNGRGLTPNTINTRFNGSIASFGYNHYQYNNIRLNGSLNKTVFNVTADSKDPNLSLNLTASGDFSNNPSFRLNGMIDSVKTLPLHFTTSPMVFRGKINASVSNITADNMDANVLITKSLFVSGNQRLPLDTIQLISGRSDTGNYIRFRSDIANAQLSGQYRLSELGSIVQSSIEPYFEVKPAASTVPVQPYNFRFSADVIYTPIISAFVPALTTMQPIHAEGSFATGSGMNALVTAPYVLYNGTEISNMSLKANTNETGLHINGNIAHLRSGTSFDVYNTRVNATALNNTIDFNLGVDDQNAKNKYYLSGLLTQPTTGTYALKLRPDSLLLNYERWTITPDNSITISPTNILANDFTLSKGGQSLSLNSLAGAGAQPLQLSFKDFRLATITGFVKSDSLLVDGVMNGNVTFRNLMQQPVFTSNLTINDLSMRKDTLGNVNLQVSSAANDRYTVNIALNGHGNDIGLTGSFAPVANDIALDLNLNVRALQLHSMQGALASTITNASGAVDGNIAIKGTASKPSVKGDLNFDKASFAITQLGSQFRIDNEKISVSENGFVFNNFTIRDSANNALTVDGTVGTTNFINYNFNLDVTAKNFQAMNSTRAQNKLYYGKLNLSSDIHISGTETSPVVDGSLTVNDGTVLNIVVPQAEPGVVDRQGVVEFVDMDAPENDSLFHAYDSINTAKSTLGMDIAMNIEIKKEAVFNVVVDEANGDFLNVRGEAILSAGIDPSGKITMVGTYTVEEGSYQVAFNFLQRKFSIEKGSTIVWTGEPTSAELNLTAIYIANTAPLDLVADQISAPTAAIRNTYLQKLPFEVHLTLTGELMQPVVAFDILLPPDKNYGVNNEIVTAVQSRLDQIRQDPGEVNKQVFALLLLGRFVGENPFQSAGGGGIDAATYARASVSKLLTEQLNSLASGLINGVDLTFDVASSDDYTTGERRNRTDLNIGLSKRLLNDRLKVTVGSNFQLEGPQNSNQQSNNIASNIAIDYQLSRDGRYMLRFYRQNEYEGVVDGLIIETGLSFALTVDYNKFSQVIHRKKQRVTNTAATGTNPSTGTN